MKSIRDWVFSQILTDSLASSLPLSGIIRSFNQERPNEELDDRGLIHQETPEAPSSLGHSEYLQHHHSQQSEGHEENHHSSPGGHDMTKLSKIDELQVKLLRLLIRLGHSRDNLMVEKTLYRLNLATLLQTGEADAKTLVLKQNRARSLAAAEEASGSSDLDFSIRILLLGKTGVGKSATVNSILGQMKTATSAFQPATDRIQEFSGTLNGIKVSFIDTPGFLPSSPSTIGRNRKIMLRVKKYLRRCPPDVVLFFERLDHINNNYNEHALLKLIGQVFGNAIWFNTILVMTHASSSLPEGPNGYQVMHESYVNHCSDLLQESINQAVLDSRLENPVLLVDNHPLCKRNSKGEKILPDGRAWISQLLSVCVCMKVLNDANRYLEFQKTVVLGPPSSLRQPSMPHLLSSMLRHQSMLSIGEPEEEVGEILLSEDEGEEDEYDQLPSIKILTKSKFNKLTELQKRDYLDELDYRETLYLKKQLKQELQKQREPIVSKEDDISAPEDSHDSSEPFALPDMAVPPSFDSDCSLHKYRGVVTSDQILFRPVHDPHGWDHDVGFDGINLETSIEIKRNVVGSVTGQLSKDKSDFSIHSQCGVAYRVLSGPSSSMGLDVQSAGDKDLICTVRSDARIRNLLKKHNVANCGVSVTSFKNKYYLGAKIEDQVYLGKRLKFVSNAGLLGEPAGKKAYGVGLEANFRGRDYPVRTDRLSLGMTVLSFDRDTVINANLESVVRLSRETKLSISGNLNNRNMGQICIKTNSSDHMEIALIALFSILRGLFRRKTPPISLNSE